MSSYSSLPTKNVFLKLLTPERASIVGLDLPELADKLRSGQLTCVQVSPVFLIL
jgi:hypothetical protein